MSTIIKTATASSLWIHRFEKAEQRERQFSHETFETLTEKGLEIPTYLELA